VNNYNFILDKSGLKNVPVYVVDKSPKGYFFRPYIPVPNAPYGGSIEYNTGNQQEVYKYFNSTEAKVYSAMFSGVPVFCDLLLENTTQPPQSFQILQVLATVSMTKTIVKTAVQGRNGTVKEYINAGDYSISLQGALFDNNKTKYPDQDVKTLLQLLMATESLKCISPLLNDIFDIHYLVIESYDMPQEAGHQNKQAFTIKAISDDPPELILSEDNA
jgi:hypothetical protein